MTPKILNTIQKSLTISKYVSIGKFQESQKSDQKNAKNPKNQKKNQKSQTNPKNPVHPIKLPKNPKSKQKPKKFRTPTKIQKIKFNNRYSNNPEEIQKIPKDRPFFYLQQYYNTTITFQQLWSLFSVGGGLKDDSVIKKIT